MLHIYIYQLFGCEQQGTGWFVIHPHLPLKKEHQLGGDLSYPLICYCYIPCYITISYGFIQVISCLYIYTHIICNHTDIYREREIDRLDQIGLDQIRFDQIYIYMLHPQSCGFSMQIFFLIPDIPGPHLCEWFLDWHGTCPTQRHLGSPWQPGPGAGA